MTTFTTDERINAEMEPIPFLGFIRLNGTSIRVYRYLLTENSQDRKEKLYYIPKEILLYSAGSINESDSIDINPSELDHLGRYFPNRDKT